MKSNHNKNYSIRNRNGRYQIRITYKGDTYTSTFIPPEDLTEAQAYLAAEKEAIRLRDKLLMGYDNHMPTFTAYADNYISTKQMLHLKRTTLNQYRYLLPRLVEFFKDTPLDAITPFKVNQFYIFLSGEYVKADGSARIIGDQLKIYIKEQNIKQIDLAKKANIGVNTLSDALRGNNVSQKTAESICTALNIPINDYFKITDKKKKLSDKTIREHITLLNNGGGRKAAIYRL